MLKKVNILVVLSACLLVVCGIWLSTNIGGHSATKNFSDSRHLAQHYPIPKDFDSNEVKSLKRLALLGSAEAADRLDRIYSNCLGHYAVANAPRPSASEANCKRELYYWVEVAAINGSTAGILQQYSFQAESNDCQEIYRAGYWLGRVPRKLMSEEPWVTEAKRQAQRERTCGW